MHFTSVLHDCHNRNDAQRLCAARAGGLCMPAAWPLGINPAAQPPALCVGTFTDITKSGQRMHLVCPTPSSECNATILPQRRIKTTRYWFHRRQPLARVLVAQI